MRDIIVIGFGVTVGSFDKAAALDRNSQVAARKLELRYVEGLTNNNCRVTSLVCFPASTFPGNACIFFGFNTSNLSPSYNVHEVGFVNLPGLKLLTRLFSLTFSLVSLLLRQKTSRTVVIYSLHQPFIVAGLISKLFFRCKVYVIVPDMPKFMRTGADSNWLIKNLKRLDQYLLQLGSSFFNGASFICNPMRELLPSLAQNSVVIDGIVEGHTDDETWCKRPTADAVKHSKIVLYTGQLVENYGVVLLIEAIKFLPCDYEIWIAGAGELRETVEQAAVVNPRLKFLGLLSAGEVAKVSCMAGCLINPRLLESEFVKYSFPSKLLEYLVSGIPVLTSRLPSMESDLKPFLHFIEELTGRGVANAIEQLFSEYYSDGMVRARDAKAYILRSRSAKRQVKKLLSIMEF